MKKLKGQSYYTNRHSCFLLQYHLVLVTKYRKPVLEGAIKEQVYDIIRSIAEERGCTILEINGESDHVHVLFEAMPQLSPMEFVNVIKTKTSRFVRRDHADELSQYYWKPLLWSDSYFVATVGENTIDTVREYIKNQ